MDELIIYDKGGQDRGIRGMFRIIRVLKSKKFDLTFIPHRSIRSALIARCANIPKRIGFHNSAGSFLYSDVVGHRSGVGVHEIERNLDLIAIFKASIGSTRPEIFPDDKDKKRVSAFLKESRKSPSKPIIAVAPGSVWATKRWLCDRFAEVSNRLIEEEDAEIVLIGGAEDEKLCRHIASNLDFAPIIAAGRLTLRQSAELLKRCHLLLSNDSAPVHLSSAVGTPVVSIFGPTVKDFGFYPYGERNTVVEIELYCRPCGSHGGNKCPEGHFRCMREITADNVLGRIRDIK